MTSTPASDKSGSSTFAPQELTRLLWSRRWLIGSVTGVAITFAALFTFTAVPFYRAKTRILIDRDRPNVVSFKEIYDLSTGADDYYTTQYKILESRAIAETALASLAATDRAWFERFEEPLQELINLRQIQPVQKSRLVDVVAEHPDPELAKRMVNALVDAYVRDAQSRRDSATSTAMERLADDAKDLQQKLRLAETALQEFKEKNQIIAMNDRQSLAAARLEKLTDELAERERTRVEFESRTRGAESAIADASFQADLPEVLESLVIGNYKKMLVEAQQEISELGQTYKAKHPRMQALSKRIAAVEAQLDHEVKAILRSIQGGYQRALHQENDVRERLEEQKKALLEMEARVIEYHILEDEANNTRRLHDTLLSRLKEVQVMTGYESTNVHRLGDPEVSKHPVRPRKMLNLLAAAVTGLLLSCGLCFALATLDRSIKSPAEAGRELDLQVLGLVPHVPAREGSGPNAVQSYDPKSIVSEAFRTIRTGLHFSEAGGTLRTLVVTSSIAGEGKSFVAMHIAISLARQGKRVLLVDADLRRPRLHRAFELERDLGFSGLLIDHGRLAELVQPTPEAGLSLLPSGVLPPNPVELLGGPTMERVLADMLASYDMVVFDSPPAAVVSDACVLATRCDRTLFVVRGFSTDRGMARRGVEALRSVGARLAGLVLNHADSKACRYYGTYGEEYGYAYASPYADAAVEA